MFNFFITRPLGFIIKLIYDLVQNYGLAIIFFTIIVKLLLMPLTVKSQKAMKKQQKIQPYLQELQAKYKDDPQKLQQETMKLYKENNISMAGGCLPLLIQFPILISLYSVIRKPLTYLLGIDFNLAENLTKVGEIVKTMNERYPDVIGKLAKLDPVDIVKNYEIQISTWCSELNFTEWVMDFDFLGLDLSVTPVTGLNYLLSFNFSSPDRLMLIIIPLLAVFTTWISMKLSQKMSGQQLQDAENNPAASMSKSMNLMMPIMTGFFAFTLPSGIGLYWIASNVMQLIQQLLIDMYFKNKGDDFDVKLPERNTNKRKKR